MKTLIIIIVTISILVNNTNNNCYAINNNNVNINQYYDNYTSYYAVYRAGEHCDKEHYAMLEYSRIYHKILLCTIIIYIP